MDAQSYSIVRLHLFCKWLSIIKKKKKKNKQTKKKNIPSLYQLSHRFYISRNTEISIFTKSNIQSIMIMINIKTLLN
jgi:hypothetical protein